MEEGGGEAVKTDGWRKTQHKKGRSDAKKVSKKEAKRARRLARAKENKLKAVAATAAASKPAKKSAPVCEPTKSVESVTQVTPGVPATVAPEKTDIGPAEVSPNQSRLHSQITSGRNQMTSALNGTANCPVFAPVFKTPSPDGPYAEKNLFILICSGHVFFKV